jgi:hypothetical protein
MLNFAKTTHNSNVKATHDTTGFSRRPATIKANRTSGLVTPPMFMTDNNLASAINPSNMNILMPLEILAKHEAHPLSAIIRTLDPTTNRLKILMPHVINRQIPILVSQNSPIQ